jgi:hypothetical protein
MVQGQAVTCLFGSPPDPAHPAPPYPGVSGTRYNPIAAQKCWAEAIRKEKESRHVHQLLDAHNKLGLDEKWAKGGRLKADVLPGYESLTVAYKKLGWKVNRSNGRVVAPDAYARVGYRRPGRRQHHGRSGGGVAAGSGPPPRSASASALAAEDCPCAWENSAWLVAGGGDKGTAPMVVAASPLAKGGEEPGMLREAPVPLGKGKAHKAGRKERVQALVRSALCQELSAILASAGPGKSCNDAGGGSTTAAAAIDDACVVDVPTVPLLKRSDHQGRRGVASGPSGDASGVSSQVPALRASSSAPQLATATRAAARQQRHLQQEQRRR